MLSPLLADADGPNLPNRTVRLRGSHFFTLRFQQIAPAATNHDDLDVPIRFQPLLQ